jgi:hypothetical protein
MKANGSFCTYGPALPRTRITTSTWLAAVQVTTFKLCRSSLRNAPYLLVDEMETQEDFFDTRVSST